MIKIIASVIVTILANTVGLIAAALMLDGFSITDVSFITAVGVFSLAVVVLGPLIMKVADQNAPYLMGGISLITILIGLILTNLITSGIQINGLSTWILATLIIWVFSLATSLLLPLIIFRKTLRKVRDQS